MNIYLVRHGEKYPIKGDPGLNSRGVKEARLLAKHFKSIQIDKIISSPSKRTIETAKIIAHFLNKPFSIDKRLSERIYFDDSFDLGYQDYLELAKKSTLDRDYVLPNNMTSVKKGKLIEGLVDDLEHDKNILLVTHEGAISDYLRNLFSIRILKKYNSAYTKYFNIKSASITMINYNKKPKLIKLTIRR
jgi:broad specificity phosphatase PhoE